ncbi:uncharacterized protein LOC144752511 [Lissotriton helveticus]
MAHMTRKSSKDCYCCIFYYVDHSVVLQSHEEVTFDAREKTSQLLLGTGCHSAFETFDLDDEGKPIKKKMIYKGILVFSSESLGIDLKDLPVVTKAIRGLLNILSETNEETNSSEEMGSAFLESRQGRLIQLIKDPKNPLQYNNILVDAGQLYSLIARAPTSSDPGAFVLNRVISMVFEDQELASSKGTGQRKNSKDRGLNEEKVSACREFVWALCKEHHWKVPNSDQCIFNNKCTNARRKFTTHQTLYAQFIYIAITGS